MWFLLRICWISTSQIKENLTETLSALSCVNFESVTLNTHHVSYLRYQIKYVHIFNMPILFSIYICLLEHKEKNVINKTFVVDNSGPHHAKLLANSSFGYNLPDNYLN